MSVARAAPLAGAALGLSLYKQSFHAMAVLVNRVTGEAFEPNARALRLRRMKTRVSAWALAMAKLRLRRRSVRLVMITLTLRPGCEWRANMIREFMLKVKAMLKNKLIAYTWVAELQKRGAVHYHVLLVVPAYVRLPKPDKAGLWPHGSTRIEAARSVWYVMKYAQKAETDGVFPHGLRLFAVCAAGDALTRAEGWEFRLSVLPAWARRLIEQEYPGWSWGKVRGGYALRPPGESEYKDIIKTDWLFFKDLNLQDIEGLW